MAETQKAKNALTRKIGPLPTWGWVAIIAGALLVYEYYKSSQNNAASQTGTGTATQPPEVFQIYPSSVSTSTTTPPTQNPSPKDKDKDKGKGSDQEPDKGGKHTHHGRQHGRQHVHHHVNHHQHKGVPPVGTPPGNPVASGQGG